LYRIIYLALLECSATVRLPAGIGVIPSTYSNTELSWVKIIK